MTRAIVGDRFDDDRPTRHYSITHSQYHEIDFNGRHRHFDGRINATSPRRVGYASPAYLTFSKVFSKAHTIDAVDDFKFALDATL
jgi:hypothetical protein